MRRSRRRTAACATLATTLLLAGCSSDTEATDTPQEDATARSATEDEGLAEPLVVRAVDYAYADLDSELPAGTSIVLQNVSEAEVHELLAFRVDDERPAQELLALPEAEFMGVLGELRGVALAPPGEDSSGLPVPPLTLEEPGRYLFLCLIPTDAPPAEVMSAVEEFVGSGQQEGAPAYPETGPPHAANGMFAEVTVTD